MKLAMVFPGQGSQAVGMLKAYAGLAEIEETRKEAERALGADFVRLLDEGPAEALNQTVNTQPAMVTAGYAAYRAWRALGGPAPDLVAGHSLGEYSALTAAGALDFKDTLPLVRFRAQAMQEAVPAGQGAKAAVDRAIEKCKARGAKRAMLLPVSAPFHSTLMQPAAEKLKTYLEKVSLRDPKIPVLNNVDVKVAPDAERIRDALVRQAASPVRWVETIRAMVGLGATHIVECGPGKVLGGMTRRIAPDVQSLTLHDKASLEAALAALKEA
jgi:[acyl-carrier-protein] S-malonyltransferase